MNKKPLTLALISALSVSAQAQADALETITVTASRAPVSSDQIIASDITITREEIELIQPLSVGELLSGYAGIDLANNGGRGQTSSVFVRGTNSEHVLVLVDGIKIGSASLGSADLQSISPDLIERIEIVKGPRAAVWGSDAIGGVIHIITRKLEDGEVRFGLSYGTDNTQEYKVAAGFAHGEGSTSVVLSKEKSDGFDVLTTAEPDEDGFDSTSINIKGQQAVSKQLALSWLLNAVTRDTEYDNAYGGANQSESDNHVWQLKADYLWNIGNTKQSTSVSLGQSRDKGLSYGNGTEKANGSLFETRRDQYSLLNHSRINQQLQLNLGADFYQEELISSTDFAETERDIQGIFAHLNFNQQAVSAELAIRHDDVDGIDGEATYNASLAYQLTSNWKLAVMKGTGFKAPTFNALYYPATAFAAGNPDLKAETSDSLEFAISGSYENFQIDINRYDSEVENLIEWKSDANFFSRPENVSVAELKGTEVSVNYNGFGGQHSFNFTDLDAADKATGGPLSRRADRQYDYQFTAQIEKASVFVQYQYVGDRVDKTFSGDIPLNSYSIVNLSASYPVTEALDISLKLHNIFDKEYQTISNYNSQGRAAYLSINYKL